MPVPIVYCCDPLRPRRVDEHFAAEAAQVRAQGATVALVDHDALLAGDVRRAVARVPDGLGAAWYRGWMVPAEKYAALAVALGERGGGLVVAPEKYRAAHELPGWYRCFAGLTPASVWRPAAPYEQVPDAELAALAARLRPGPAVVKDYVKSRKHEWAEACFVPDLADAGAVRRVVRRFVELQEEFLAGGIVLREYEEFLRPAGVAGEARVWWLDARPVLVTPHPDSPHPRAPELGDLGEVGRAVAALGCRFVTTDLAVRADGVLRVVEVGDGQVSDLHPDADLAAFAAMLTTG